MKFWLYLVLAVFMSISVACGGTTYWTYTSIDRPAHIVHPVLIPVWVDQNFTGAQVEEIKAAIAEWNYVLNGQIVITLKMKRALGSDKKYYEYPDSFATWEDGNRILKECEHTNLGWVIFNLDSKSKHLDDDTEGVLAYVTGVDTHFVNVIGDRLGTRSLKDILMHEFGHLLGARHVNTPSLEFPVYDQHQLGCIDKITVAQVATTHELNLSTLNYCITPYFE